MDEGWMRDEGGMDEGCTTHLRVPPPAARVHLVPSDVNVLIREQLRELRENCPNQRGGSGARGVQGDKVEPLELVAGVCLCGHKVTVGA